MRAILLAVGLAGCMENPLDAGSTSGATEPAPPTSSVTLARPDVMIDALAVDQDAVYFTAEDGFLYSVPKTLADGGAPPEPTRLAQASVPGSAYTEGLVSDGQTLYWTALGDGVQTGAVLSFAKSGAGAVATIAAGEARPTGIAVDATSVYWTNQGPPPPLSANSLTPPPPGVFVAPKSGGAVSILSSEQGSPDVIALSDDAVLWHEGGDLRMIPKGGGAVVTLVSMPTAWQSSDLAVGGGAVAFGIGAAGEWAMGTVTLGGGALTTLASELIEPAGVIATGGAALWQVGGGADVGEIDEVPLTGGSETTAAEGDGAADGAGASDVGARLFVSDGEAFYWVEYWTAGGQLEVAVRARP